MWTTLVRSLADVASVSLFVLFLDTSIPSPTLPRPPVHFVCCCCRLHTPPTPRSVSGLIDYTEFCEILQVDASPQVERLFQMFDKDKSGQIDVKEFLIGLSNFTGAGKEEKLKFAFMVRVAHGRQRHRPVTRLSPPPAPLQIATVATPCGWNLLVCRGTCLPPCACVVPAHHC